MPEAALQSQVTKHPGTPRPKRGVKWQMRFLKALSNNPSVELACRAASITRQHAYRVRSKQPEFARAWEDAIESAIDIAEGTMANLAVNGEDSDIFMKLREGEGKEKIVVAGHRKERFPQLLQFYLKARRPQIYGDKSNVDLTSGGAPISPVAASQVIIQLPSNGRDQLPAINVAPAQQQLPAPQETAPALQSPQGELPTPAQVDKPK